MDPCGVPTLGFLHTAESHVATFDGLVSDVDPDCMPLRSVRPDLLEGARLDGLDNTAVGEDLHAALAALGDRGAHVVVCTCSTLGGLSEQRAPEARPLVLRVDRPKVSVASSCCRRSSAPR
jgi:hypothetical protein